MAVIFHDESDTGGAASDPYPDWQMSRRAAIVRLTAAWLGGLLPAGGVMADTASTGARTTEAEAALRDVIAPLSRPTPDAFAALMDYDPASDPNAPYFRSTVTRATRIRPFAATQAHPALDSRPGLATLATTNRTIGRHTPDDRRAVRHSEMPAGGVQIPRFLGMCDVVVQWSGTGIIPNPALTDAAHRNGAACLGTIFQPDARLYSGSEAQVAEVARKLVSLARYFGFDGYFINHETRDDRARARLIRLMTAIRAVAAAEELPNFAIQYYNGFTDVAGLFAAVAEHPAASSVMLDQGWSGYGGPGSCCSGAPIDPHKAALAAEALKHSRYDLYYGLQLYPGPGYIGVAAPLVISPNDGKWSLGGLQTYSLDDGILNIHRARSEGRSAAFLPPNADLPAIERLVYSGQTGNPALDNTPSATQSAIYAGRRIYSERSTTSEKSANTDPDQADLPISYGVSNFIAERSVIGSLPFVTHFNLGEGRAFFVEGQQVSDRAWFNLGIQDILPTWQWWRAPFAGLTDRTRAPTGLLDVEYDQSLAYDGGASIRAHGSLGERNATRIHLFKTDIALPLGTYIELATWGRGADRERSRLGLVFADQPEQVTWMPLDPGSSPNADTWHMERMHVAAHAGRHLASLLLGFEASATDTSPIDIRFGRLAIFDTPPTPSPSPRDVKLDRRIVDPASGTIGLALQWQTEGRFDLFALDGARGTRIWIGRIDGNAFYSPTALPAGMGAATIEVQSIAAGIRGGAIYIRV